MSYARGSFALERVEGVAQGYPHPVARQMGARSPYIERNQDISDPIDDSRDSLVGFDRAGIRVAIREIKRQSIGQRCTDTGRQHPGEVDLVPTRNDSPRSRELHAGFADIDIRSADATTDERVERSEPWYPQLR